jgi:hypothetical protein
MPGSAAINIDLEELQDIMEDLQEAPAGSEKRRNALTRDDIMIIARVVQAVSHKSCTRGLTEDEVGKWKFVCGTFNKGILAVGWLLVAAVIGGIMRGAWWAVQHGIMEVATEAAKKGAGK